jgi:hypothetical protein
MVGTGVKFLYFAPMYAMARARIEFCSRFSSLMPCVTSAGPRANLKHIMIWVLPLALEAGGQAGLAARAWFYK